MTIDEVIETIQKTFLEPETEDDIRVSFAEFCALESAIEYLKNLKG